MSGCKPKVPEQHIASRVKLRRFPIFSWKGKSQVVERCRNVNCKFSAELNLFTILLGNPGFDLFTAIKNGPADQSRCKLALISLAPLNAAPLYRAVPG